MKNGEYFPHIRMIVPRSTLGDRMNKRTAIIAISPAVFARSLGIGANGVIHACRLDARLGDLHLETDCMEFKRATYSIERDAFLMVVSHPDLPVVPEGSMMPELEVIIHLVKPEPASVT